MTDRTNVLYRPGMIRETIILVSPWAAMASNHLVAQESCMTADSRFTVHENGTVTDSTTGLMWKQCPEGKTGADCAQGAATINHVAFPGTESSIIRSASGGIDYNTKAWAANFADGPTHVEDDNIPRHLRLVRTVE